MDGAPLTVVVNGSLGGLRYSGAKRNLVAVVQEARLALPDILAVDLGSHTVSHLEDPGEGT